MQAVHSCQSISMLYLESFSAFSSCYVAIMASHLFLSFFCLTVMMMFAAVNFTILANVGVFQVVQG